MKLDMDNIKRSAREAGERSKDNAERIINAAREGAANGLDLVTYVANKASEKLRGR